jgi:hypothetical protein
MNCIMHYDKEGCVLTVHQAETGILMIRIKNLQSFTRPLDIVSFEEAWFVEKDNKKE